MKLYLIVRDDLPVGLQAAQACHALREFVEAYPDIDAEWHANSKTLVLLRLPSETQLRELAEKADKLGIECAMNHEPDLEGSLTSLALGPGARQLVRRLPLLGQAA